MPGLRNVRNSNLNRITFELIKKRAIPHIGAPEIASEFKKVVVKLDELDENLQPILINLESIFNDYMQIRSQYLEKSHAAKNRNLLTQAAINALQKIDELHIKLKQKVVAFIEYAINVSTTDQNEENMGMLQFKIHFHVNTEEMLTNDKKYYRKHRHLVIFESSILAGLAKNIRDIKDLIEKIQKQPSRKNGLSAMLFLFYKDDHSELFTKFDKYIACFKRLFASCSMDGNGGLQQYRQRMVKFYSSVEATQNSRTATHARLTPFIPH
jgi:exonuclease VII large subunit